MYFTLYTSKLDTIKTDKFQQLYLSDFYQKSLISEEIPMKIVVGINLPGKDLLYIHQNFR